ncbi:MULTISPECIES: AraC family transcriptional regulator [Elizabethkingia]|uniref:AraC family transcriptional regulator n=1 Tax=Elizabethkingia anophelis TaxID=1117645 RepID=A0A494J8Q3_9FLAO|nr:MULTISPECIES: AraC family transcriptional regulator [Elizabethkingia]AQX51301.1 AraC family transcriptional regulator [Elizabethkingia anophelis]MCT4196715.1 helix-turn-helix transcriptional regulator [Elizabethkingia anophelis]MCT4225341.1 helix-turn-helix transcriptional regulator [Elizabethkingia anophelis]MCT4306932.1 helix-turn-helix transcriptional regulator [Elizabethkingia anophelis]MDV2472691.1 AraC family transcriptional regulator [Elizabethkingia anophelis]
MGLIQALPDIDKHSKSVFVMHEKSEKLIPFHRHTKGQLSYVEGGIAYITTNNKTYVVPAKHFFWIPQGMEHLLRIGHSATVLRSLYFYAYDDHTDPFYTKLGIYPASELLIQMIKYTEIWDEKHVKSKDHNFEFLISLKNILPKISNEALPIILPMTDDQQMNKILHYLDSNINETLTLISISKRFGMSERSVSRLFRSALDISFLQYLKTLRMVKAIELILKSNKSINEIAYEVGYSSISTFSDTFHEFTQSRPSDLRKTKNLS